MARIDHTAAEELDEISARVRLETEMRLRVDRQRADALYSEWLSVRARRNDPKDDYAAFEDQIAADRESELARLITTMPASHAWMILRKIEVLEFYVGSEGGTAWIDNREVTMIAAIKADLLRFEPRGD